MITIYKIAIASQKGGVAKTSTALALSAGLKQNGYKCLMVDLDSQASLTKTFKAQNSGTHSIADVLQGSAGIQEAIVNCSTADIIPSSAMMKDDTLNKLPDFERAYRLKEILAPIESEYDFCLFDCPPAIGLATALSLTAADGVLIPVTADRYCLDDITELLNSIAGAKKYTNKELKILGFLLVKYESRSVLSRDVATMIKQRADKYGTILFDTPIRQCVAIREAQMRYNPDIFDYAPNSNAAADYKACVDTLLKEIKADGRS